MSLSLSRKAKADPNHTIEAVRLWVGRKSQSYLLSKKDGSFFAEAERRKPTWKRPANSSSLILIKLSD